MPLEEENFLSHVLPSQNNVVAHPSRRNYCPQVFFIFFIKTSGLSDLEPICEIIEMLMSRSKKSLIILIFCLISRIASPCRHFLKFMLYAVVENASILFTLDYLSESSDFGELDKFLLFYNIANI